MENCGHALCATDGVPGGVSDRRMDTVRDETPRLTVGQQALQWHLVEWERDLGE